MGKIVSKVRQLRFEYQLKAGRSVSVQEVASATSMSRNRLTNIELGKIDLISTEELERLCAFYTSVLGRFIDIHDIMGYDPNKIQALDSAAI